MVLAAGAAVAVLVHYLVLLPAEKIVGAAVHEFHGLHGSFVQMVPVGSPGE